MTPPPTNAPLRATGMRLALFLLAALAPLLVFRSATGFEFVSHDDPIHVYENPFVTNPGLDSLAHFWKGPHEGLYIPVSYSLWMAQASLAKRVPPPGQTLPSYSALDFRLFHAVNLATHAANTGLAFLILAELLPGAPWAACAGALLFGLHPLQAESVAWVSEFKGLAAGFFSLFSIFLYLVRLRTGKRRWHLLAALLFALALLSKPSAVAVPFIAGLLAWCSPAAGPGLAKRLARDLIPWLALAVPVTLVTSMAQPAETGLVFKPPLVLRPVVFLDTLAFYLGKLVWPAGLGIDYGRTPARVVRAWLMHPVWLAPLPLLYAAWRFRRPPSRLAAPLAVLCAGILPVSGLAVFHYQYFSTVADRYMYLAMLGPALALAALLASVWSLAAGRAAVLAAGVLIGALAWRASDQASTWRNYEPLYANAVAVNPRSPIANKMLGFIAEHAGRQSEAEGRYRAALAGNPDYEPARAELLRLLLAQGKLAEAVPVVSDWLARRPGNPDGYNLLGDIMAAMGRTADAVACYRRSLALRPDQPELRNKLAGLEGR